MLNDPDALSIDEQMQLDRYKIPRHLGFFSLKRDMKNRLD